MKHLLFFLLLFIPVGLRADLITNNGHGSFSCGFNSNTGDYVVDGQLSFVARDPHGKALNASLYFATDSATPCTPSLPVLFGIFDSSKPAPYDVYGDRVGGSWHYLGHSFNADPDGLGSCKTNDPHDSACGLLIGLDQTGSLSIELATEDHSNDWTWLDLEAQVTSFHITPGVTPDDCLPGQPYRGTFTFASVPEPAEWSLILAAVPVFMAIRYRRSKAKRSIV